MTFDRVEKPRTFKLVRSEDVSGVSGTGIIAEGVVFHNDRVAVVWYGKFQSTEIVDSIDILIGIHGHEGRTQIRWCE